MSQGKKSSALDQLEKAFQEQQRISQEKLETQNKKKKQLMHVGIIVLVVAVLTLMVVVYARAKQDTEKVVESSQLNEDGKVVPEKKSAPLFLTDEQKQDWENKEVDDTQVFMQFSDKLMMKSGGTSLGLQLVNPPYSAYSIETKIVMKENESDVLYNSELLKPGDYLETVELTKALEVGVHPVLIKFSFYNEDGETLMGNYQKETSIEVHT